MVAACMLLPAAPSITCCCCSCCCSSCHVHHYSHQATLKELEQELQEAKAQHAAHMQQLRSQHEDLEARASSMLQQAQQRLSATAVADSEVCAARDKATAAVEMEAVAEASGRRSGARWRGVAPCCTCVGGWPPSAPAAECVIWVAQGAQGMSCYASGPGVDLLAPLDCSQCPLLCACVCACCRSELLQAALHAVEQEVAAEVAAYKATRRADALQQLAGHLPNDTAAAAEQLERQTAELQRLEAAVADKAAVLQKLGEEVAQKQLHLTHSLGSSERSVDGHALASSREQLAAVQQQLAQVEKQLTAADASLIDKRAAVGEAEEQLAALRRETSVCEPRLSSLRQQLQELEANIRARITEHQVSWHTHSSIACMVVYLGSMHAAESGLIVSLCRLHPATEPFCTTACHVLSPLALSWHVDQC